MSQTLWISREVDPASHFVRSLTEKGIDVSGAPMIRTIQVDLPPSLPRVDWIFFASKNAVTHFFAQQPDTGKARLAAVGEGTARALAKHGTVNFIGKNSDTEEVGKEFREVLGMQDVLFPMSDISVRTVQQLLPAGQVHEVICYRTEEDPKPVGHPDILVFSSPSNVEAFLRVNSIAAHQVVIAFGKTTAKSLQHHGAGQVVTSRGTSDKALLDAINSALGS